MTISFVYHLFIYVYPQNELYIYNHTYSNCNSDREKEDKALDLGESYVWDFNVIHSVSVSSNPTLHYAMLDEIGVLKQRGHVCFVALN